MQHHELHGLIPHDVGQLGRSIDGRLLVGLPADGDQDPRQVDAAVGGPAGAVVVQREEVDGQRAEREDIAAGIDEFMIRQPLGVVGCISPWNLPLYLFTWKIAPALATGNCVVAKPSELTPMTAYLLSKACIEAGLPAGVFNLVTGLGPVVGEALAAHPDVDMISFTGRLSGIPAAPGAFGAVAARMSL